ncbi:hypothetical protein N7478_003158 [Penicillium angulare]|uniref:uncharacterized protein n=1 Tax=Penicillium angulare TaxID=116970 RepID=UPI002541CBC8|nr:uncharacterized protein N7478_003158 [Penicillium angulare]KAJ5287472.1 hypothetical protein N7478_003158 [Penicillium angulare]
MGLKMAEFEPLPVSSYFTNPNPDFELTPKDAPFVPYWAHCRVQCAQNLLPASDEPIEYDHDDEDYSDNCFFFPEDCSYTPPKDWVVETQHPHIKDREDQVQQDTQATLGRTDNMLPDLPDIKMLDSEALGDLLDDNLSPPEITTMIVFATNGAVFAYASALSSRQLRNLSATYGAAYTCYAKTASSGNLTGVNPASHPSSYVTAQSMSLGDVGSIVFELDDSVAVVTRIADKVLLAAIGPNKIEQATANGTDPEYLAIENGAATDPSSGNGATSDIAQSDTQRAVVAPPSPNPPARNGALDTQHEIDRSVDLERLASLNLSASPSVLLALESKCAALGRFLGQKLHDLESPEDF